MTQCDLSDSEKFMALMILNKNFREPILTAVKKGDKKQVIKILKECNISLSTDEISNIMAWDDNMVLEGYRKIIEISKTVYDPGSGNW